MIRTATLATETSLLASALLQFSPVQKATAPTVHYATKPSETQEDAMSRVQAFRARQTN